MAERSSGRGRSACCGGVPDGAACVGTGMASGLALGLVAGLLSRRPLAMALAGMAVGGLVAAGSIIRSGAELAGSEMALGEALALKAELGGGDGRWVPVERSTRG